MSTKLYKIEYRTNNVTYRLASSLKEALLVEAQGIEVVKVELYDDLYNMDALEQINHCKKMNGQVIGE